MVGDYSKNSSFLISSGAGLYCLSRYQHMKRFKDCVIFPTQGQSFSELLKIVGNECVNKGIRVDFSSSFFENDTIGAYVDFDGLPASKLVLNASEGKGGVAILNIVPLPKSGCSMLNIPEYNAILDAFVATVFKTIAERSGNMIKMNTEDYTLEEIIPSSFKYLDRWLKCFPLSHHPLDEHRWYDFLISLIKTKERVGSSVLCEYVKEKYDWSENDLYDMEMRFESQMDLLEYYEDNR